MAGHTGQSSQLFPIATGGNATFLATTKIGLNVSHTDAGSLENERIWIPCEHSRLITTCAANRIARSLSTAGAHYHSTEHGR